jgi:hypothetical protein
MHPGTPQIIQTHFPPFGRLAFLAGGAAATKVCFGGAEIATRARASSSAPLAGSTGEAGWTLPAA